MEIESWHAVHTSSEGVTRWKGTFTRSGCLPIRQVLIYPDDHVLSEDIMDITLGIAGLSKLARLQGSAAARLRSRCELHV